MQTSITLLERALTVAPLHVWTEKLSLTRDALSVAKHHGKLSPVIAGGLASELGEDPVMWAGVAAIEAAKDSPSKRALIKRLKAMRTW